MVEPNTSEERGGGGFELTLDKWLENLEDASGDRYGSDQASDFTNQGRVGYGSRQGDRESKLVSKC